MSKHTPGPWEHRERLTTFSVRTKDKLRVCAHREPTERTIAFISYNSLNAEANARLIASSPTMYEYINKKATAGDCEAKEIISKINA